MVIITYKFKKFILILTVVLSGIAFFTNVENMILYVKTALTFCANSLIPSIFIFMIFSSFTLYSSAFSGIFNYIPKKILNILGICRKYVSHIFICSLCGFVSGAKVICDDFRENGGSEIDFSNSVILSSNAGIGFLISCVGVKIWGDIRFGIYLFVIQIFIAFFLGKLLLKKDNINSNEAFVCQKYSSLSTAFSRAVSSSVSTILVMCAFVITFACICEAFCNALGIREESPIRYILIFICEFSRGCFNTINFESSLICAFFTGFCVGFGGLCVHFQIFSVCEGLPLDKLRFIIFKIFHGIFCGIFAVFYAFITKIEPLKNTFEYIDIASDNSLISTIFFICIAFVFIKAILKTFFRKLY